MRRSALELLTMTLLACCVLVAARPQAAQAHGPVAPVATSFLARIDSTPAGLQAKVVDGDLRMWLRVPASETVVVLDYLGAPYLRFTQAGVAVNENSAMWYLNQTPVALSPPANLTRTTPPDWQHASGGHVYNWHDGRLGGLALVARAPGTSFVGVWRIPLLIDGRATAIAGGLWYAPDPSIAWFWPIAVILLCVVAAWRVRRPALDARVARTLGVGALVGLTIAGCARELYGRPTVSVLQYIELVILLAFVAWGARRVLFGSPGYFTYFLIGFAAVWQGVVLVPTLVHGYVLAAVPALIARIGAVLCLGTGVGLLVLVFRLAEQPRAARAARKEASTSSKSGGSPVPWTPDDPSELADAAGMMEATMPPPKPTP